MKKLESITGAASSRGVAWWLSVRAEPIGMIVQPPSRSRRLSVCTVTIGACPIFRRNVTWRRSLRRSGCRRRSWFRSGCLRCLTRLSLSGGRVFEVTAGDIIPL